MLAKPLLLTGAHPACCPWVPKHPSRLLGKLVQSQALLLRLCQAAALLLQPLPAQFLLPSQRLPGAHPGMARVHLRQLRPLPLASQTSLPKLGNEDDAVMFGPCLLGPQVPHSLALQLLKVLLAVAS